ILMMQTAAHSTRSRSAGYSSRSNKIKVELPKPTPDPRVTISYDKIHGYSPGEMVTASISITVPERPVTILKI
ncbi:hypothetical protein PFISCL1PPCAC_8941, partial [Pristionchus fissidentatus]